MAEPLHVLVGGWQAPTVAAAFLRDARLGVYIDALTECEVELRTWDHVQFLILPEDAADPRAAARRGAVSLDGDDLPWADAILLRASDFAVAACTICDRVAFEPGAAERHAAETGHSVGGAAGAALAALLDAIEAKPALLRNRALVLDIEEDLPALAGSMLSHEVVQRAVRLADLTIVGSPSCGRVVEEHGGEWRVVATMDPGWKPPASLVAAAGSLAAPDSIGAVPISRRAAELREALDWAAAHAGRALAREQGGADAAEPESTAVLEHRRSARRRSAQEAATLERLRAGRDVCWREDMPDEPLVSVVIPTYSRGRILVERSLASVLAQTYRNIEVVVVGDHATLETLEAIATVDDPRVRFVDLPERSPYHPNPFLRWLQVGTRPYNLAIRLARGDFIAPNADDDEFTPDHVELLLSAALEHRLEFVYGDSLMESADSSWSRVGVWPPREGGICGGAVLYAAPLRFIEMDEECWRDLEPNDWNHFRRMLDAGVRAGHVPEIVFRHYREGREWHRPTAVAAQVAAASR